MGNDFDRVLHHFFNRIGEFAFNPNKGYAADAIDSNATATPLGLHVVFIYVNASHRPFHVCDSLRFCRVSSSFLTRPPSFFACLFPLLSPSFLTATFSMASKSTSLMFSFLHFCDASAHLLSPPFETCQHRGTTKTVVLDAAHAPLPIGYVKLIGYSICCARRS